ncbi:MAG: 5-methyltetrahydropteroyltriglutamate--homocysteine S-methyltransferase, partial [Iodobacter sp.]
MTTAHILGFPRIGAQRELKFATEQFWKGEINETALAQTGSALRRQHWQWQSELDFVTVGDFAWYDQMLNTAALLGALPSRFGFAAKDLTLKQYFELARGNSDQPALEMTKWFDTNYHYLVPELDENTDFAGGVDWFFYEIEEARSLGYTVKPVLPGPLTFLYLAKAKTAGLDKLSLLPKITEAYRRILERLAKMGVEWLQLDEPVLGLDLEPEWLAAFEPVYHSLKNCGPKILLATYFESVEAHAALLRSLPVAGVHLDLVRAPQQLDAFITGWPKTKVLSLGVIDGRNIWVSDLSAILARLKTAGDIPFWISASCSLLHVPVDLAQETGLDEELKGWLAFARQKLQEINLLKRALSGENVSDELAVNAARVASRHSSARIHNPAVAARLQGLSEADARRQNGFAS